MTASNAAVDKGSSKSGVEKAATKAPEKLAEKRRALGRGLESLLPGPRSVPTPNAQDRRGAVDPIAAARASVPGNTPTPATNAPTAIGQDHEKTVIDLEGSDGTNEANSAAPDSRIVSNGHIERGEAVVQLRLDQIELNPYQTRREFDQQALEELSRSILTQGVLQPIAVRPWGSPEKDRFILILGERRLRASKLAGQTTIPAIIKRVSEQQAAEMTLVENLQRQDLNCLEQAQAFASLSSVFGLTQEEIGKRVGVSREQVSNYLRLLKLPEDVRGALRRGELSYSQARLLLSLDDDSQIVKIAGMVIKQKMSVAALEDLVRDINIPGAASAERKQGGARWVDPNVRAAQRSLETVLGMRVRIQDRKGKGKITIEYGTLDDFDRVVRMLKG